MPTIKLYLLGGFQVTRHDRPLTAFRSERARALLAYLALESNRPLTRVQLARLFWGQHELEVARANLRVTLSNLRQVLQPLDLIHATYHTVQFDASHPEFWCDLLAVQAQVEALLHSDQPLPIAQLKDLLQQELLEGFERIDSPSFVAWLQQRRQWLRLLLDQLRLDEPRTDGMAASVPIPTGPPGGGSLPLLVDRSAVDRSAEPPPAAPAAARENAAVGYGWSGIPHDDVLYGRQAELAQLRQWLIQDRCRLIAIVGMGGQGKTALAAHLVHSLASALAPPLSGTGDAVSLANCTANSQQDDFDQVLWRSLLNAPPLSEVLQDWLQVLSQQQLNKLPPSLDRQLDLLLGYLQRQRCLLVLDNVESILSTGERAGYYQPGYEDYRQLLQRIAAYPHQSCLLLTSREQLHELDLLQVANKIVHTLRLAGLTAEAGQAMLQAIGLSGSPDAMSEVVRRYSGNPLGLKLVAVTIQELFAGCIAHFLAQETLAFDDIRDVLDQHFARLADIERDLMFWLAIERELLPFAALYENLVQPPQRREVLEAVRSLQRRSLLEQVDERFYLQNVIIEYMTDRLVAAMSQEILEFGFSILDFGVAAPQSKIQTLESKILTAYLNRYALVKAQAKEYVREIQVRLLLQPVANFLAGRWSKAAVAMRLQQLLQRLRSEAPLAPGYAAANLLHLLLYLQIDLLGYDFSWLAVWQTDLCRANLTGVNFTQADLTHSIFLEPLESVRVLAFSPDGQRLVAGTHNGNIHVWRLVDRQPERLLQGHHGMIYAVALSLSNASGPQLLASASADQTIRLWDLATGELYCILRGHGCEVVLVAFDPTGELLISMGYDGIIRTWELRTLLNNPVCDQSRTIFGGTGVPTYAAAASGDGAWVATGDDNGIVRCWDVQRGQLRASLQGHAYGIIDLVFSPASKILVSSSHDQTLRLWALADQAHGPELYQPHHILPEPAEWLAFSPDNTLLASSFLQQITLWAVREPTERGELRQRLIGHTSRVSALAFSPDGCILASAGYDQTILLWNVQTGRIERKLYGQAWAVELVRFSPDGTTFVSSYFDHTVHLWARDGRHLHTLRGHQDVVRHAAWSSDSQLLATASHDPIIRVWNVHSGEHHVNLRRHASYMDALAFRPGAKGALLASGSDTLISLWDARTGEYLDTLEGHSTPIKFIAFTPAGTLLATPGCDQTIRIWEIPSGQLRHVLQGHTSMVCNVAFHPNGRLLATASDDTTIRLWNTIEGRVCQILQGHTQAVFKVQFTSDGNTLISVSDDQTLRVWSLDAPTGEYQLSHVLPESIYKNDCVVLSPDSTTLVSGDMDGIVRLWDLDTGQLRQALHGHNNLITSVDVSPDGRQVVSGCSDGTVRLWDVQSGECLHTLQPEGPYAGMNITGVIGITTAQKAALLALGAVESD